MKVFLSYGRKAGADFVERIHAALTREGYACWKDNHDIPFDEDWRRAILQGLTDTERTFAFLTGHALRPDSPCLDELRIARHVNGGPITLILLEPVDIPAWLDRRNALDMTGWATQGSDPVWFEACLAQLRGVLADPANQAQAAELRDLRRVLAPTPQEYEMPALLDGFVGREWLHALIEAWRRGPASERMICIIGGPGAGKSAFAAWLAHFQRGTVIALNLCRHGSDLRNSPDQVVRTLAYLIAAELPDFRLALKNWLAESERHGKQVESANASDLFDLLLNARLHHLTNGRKDGERLVLVIDSLDETMIGGRSTLAELLEEKARHLPPWVAVVLTTRPEPRFETLLGAVKQHRIEDYPGNADDIEIYARGWLGTRDMPPAARDALVARVAAAAEGNMLALTVFRKAVGEGAIDLDAGTLPQGLDAILLKWMRRQFHDVTAYQRDILPLLDILAAAARPVPFDVLSTIRQWSPRQCQSIIERLGSLFPVRDAALSAWHPALMDFLASPAATSDYMTDAASGAAVLHAQLWREATVAAPDDFTAMVLPRLVARRSAEQLGGDMAAPAAAAMLQAVSRGAKTLQRFPTWDRAQSWWEMLALLAKVTGDRWIGWAAYSADMDGDIHVHRGDLSRALTAYRTGMAIRTRLASSDDGNMEWQRDLSVSHNKIGDVLVSQGDLRGGLTAYRAGMTIAMRLVSSDDSNALWQRDLSISHNRIGDVLVSQGDLIGALTAYRAGMAIAMRLVSSNDGNALWQRDLSISHNKIGDVLVSQRDLGGALTAYRAGMIIRTRLASSDDGNAEWQRDLSVSHNKIGDVLVSQGDLNGALTAYRAGMAIATRLSSSDDGNALWQRDLSISHNKIGDVLVSQGDLIGALTVYRAGMAIAMRLASSDGGNALCQRDLSVSHNKIGDVLVSQRDLGGALTEYRAGMVIRTQLALSDDGNAEWQRDLFVSLFKLTKVLLQSGQRGESYLTAQRLVSQAEVMAARFPQDRQRDDYLRVARELLAQTCGSDA